MRTHLNTEYKGINLTAPSFIMIDLDLKDFEYSTDNLDRVLNKTLRKLCDLFDGAHPTVLWTGNGYHVYQPVHGFILEKIDRFACFIDPHKKDLTSRFMQFAENFITDKKVIRSTDHPSNHVFSEFPALSTPNAIKR